MRSLQKLNKNGNRLFRRLKKFLKHILYFLVFYSGLLHILVILFKNIKRNHSAIILFYHRFSFGKKEDKLLPSLDIGEFKKQLLYLKKFYNFISMDELAKIFKNRRKFTRPSIVVTIDDGYLDNYRLAYPFLHQYRIPATIYLTAGLIGTGLGLWVDEIEYALIHARVQSFCFRELFEDEVFDISTLQGKKRSEKMLYSTMLQLGNSQRQYLIQRLFEILDVDKSAIKDGQRVMLDWEEVIEMSKNGIYFGAHTLSHPFLPGMPLDEAKNEIKKSKEIVENWIGKPVKHFAIPNGRPEDFTNELRVFCEEIGFDTIVTTESGIVDSNFDTFSLKRVIPPPPLYYFACEIAKYFFFTKN